MCGQFRRGLTAVDASLDVFRARPSLVVLPLASLVTVGTAYAALGIALLHYGLVGTFFTSSILQYGVMFVALSISSVFGIFFNAAIVHCTAQHFRGETPSVRDGLLESWAVNGTIAKWGLVSATIGTTLFIAEDNVPGLGSLARSVLDLAWAALTFFIVPVIVIEQPSSVRAGLKKSANAFSETWGESVTATIGIALAILPIGIVGAVLVGYAYIAASGTSAYVFGLTGGLLLTACVVITQVLGMVVRTALYHYATTGDDVELVGALGHDGVFPED